jgi:hypothetical protein
MQLEDVAINKLNRPCLFHSYIVISSPVSLPSHHGIVIPGGIFFYT